MSFSRAVFCAALLMVTVLSPTAAAAQSCDAILKHGLFDESLFKDDQVHDSYFANWYRSNYSRFGGSQGMESYNVDATLLAGVKGDMSKAYQSWDEVNQAIEQSSTSVSSDRQKLSNWIRSASPVLAEAWSKCMTADGFHVSAKWTSDKNVFFVVFRFNSVDSEHPKTIVHSLSPGNALTCEPLKERPVGLAPEPIRCTRSRNVATNVSWRADSRSLEFPAAVIDFPPYDEGRPAPPPVVLTGHCEGDNPDTDSGKIVNIAAGCGLNVTPSHNGTMTIALTVNYNATRQSQIQLRNAYQFTGDIQRTGAQFHSTNAVAKGGIGNAKAVDRIPVQVGVPVRVWFQMQDMSPATGGSVVGHWTADVEVTIQ